MVFLLLPLFVLLLLCVLLHGAFFGGQVGEFNPWEEAAKKENEEICNKSEVKDSSNAVELPPEDGFDPWKNKDEI